MANPERSLGESAGKSIRNVGLGLVVLGALFAPEIIIPSILLSAGGEAIKENTGNHSQG